MPAASRRRSTSGAVRWSVGAPAVSSERTSRVVNSPIATPAVTGTTAIVETTRRGAIARFAVRSLAIWIRIRLRNRSGNLCVNPAKLCAAKRIRTLSRTARTVALRRSSLNIAISPMLSPVAATPSTRIAPPGGSSTASRRPVATT